MNAGLLFREEWSSGAVGVAGCCWVHVSGWEVAWFGMAVVGIGMGGRCQLVAEWGF